MLEEAAPFDWHRGSSYRRSHMFAYELQDMAWRPESRRGACCETQTRRGYGDKAGVLLPRGTCGKREQVQYGLGVQRRKGSHRGSRREGEALDTVMSAVRDWITLEHTRLDLLCSVPGSDKIEATGIVLDVWLTHSQDAFCRASTARL